MEFSSKSASGWCFQAKLYYLKKTGRWGVYYCKPGMSNIRPGGQIRPDKDSNLAHQTVLENVKECI